MPRIDELWAYVVADSAPDDEGIPAMMQPNGMWGPMVGADRERVDSLRDQAKEVARVLGKPVKLIRSTGIEVVEVIEP